MARRAHKVNRTKSEEKERRKTKFGFNLYLIIAFHIIYDNAKLLSLVFVFSLYALETFETV